MILYCGSRWLYCHFTYMWSSYLSKSRFYLIWKISAGLYLQIAQSFIYSFGNHISFLSLCYIACDQQMYGISGNTCSFFKSNSLLLFFPFCLVSFHGLYFDSIFVAPRYQPKLCVGKILVWVKLSPNFKKMSNKSKFLILSPRSLPI